MCILMCRSKLYKIRNQDKPHCKRYIPRMKFLILITALLTQAFWAAAQKQIACNYAEINKDQYDRCGNIQYLLANPQIKKQAGKLAIPVSGNVPKVFKDDNSDDHYQTYEYVGDINDTELSLIKCTGYNNEEFYVVNRLTGTIDTLIGPPVFAQSMKDFACISNPGTDEIQRIQICEIKNGKISTRAFLKGNTVTFFENISCIGRNTMLAKDNTGKYWKLNFRENDE